MLGRGSGGDTEASLSGSWAASMQAAFAASVGRPAWWVMALAAFLVRGGFFVVLLPLISLPSPSALATALAPSIEALALSRQSAEAALVGTAVLAVVVCVLAAAAYAGSWLDLALEREAEASDELDLPARTGQPSAWRSLGLRLATHTPTLLAVAYATVRIVVETYRELLSPGSPTVPIALRVLARAPDAVAVAAITWLLCEALGGLAARRAAEGEAVGGALRGALGDLVGRRGVATFVVTDIVVLVALALHLAVVSRAAEHVRAYLLGGAGDVSLGAALLLLVTTWLLGLAVLGAALAWRTTAWTVATAPRRAV